MRSSLGKAVFARINCLFEPIDIHVARDAQNRLRSPFGLIVDAENDRATAGE